MSRFQEISRYRLRPSYIRFAQELARNPYAQQAASKIGAAARGYIQRKWNSAMSSGRMSDETVFSRGTTRATGNVMHAGVVPSGSSSMRVSRPNRRRFKLPRGRFRGHNRGFKGRRRRFKRARKGKFMRNLWRMMHCPQNLRSTCAAFKLSGGTGTRTWACDIVGQDRDLMNMYSRRPTGGFFWAGTSTPGSATTQAPYGGPRKLHITSFKKKYILQNKCNWMMHLKVYECLLRRDHDLAPLTGPTSQNAFLTELFTDGDDSGGNKGPFTPGYAGGGDFLSQVYQNPTYTPYCSSMFCAMFKILKCTSIKLSPNDYQTYTLSLRRKAFDFLRLRATDVADATDKYLNGIGRWTKMLVFTWVGGPVDTGSLSDVNQSKAANALAWQTDTDIKFYWENTSLPLRTICSSNARSTELGRGDTVGQYKTIGTVPYGVPYTEVVETVPASSVIQTDDAAVSVP